MPSPTSWVFIVWAYAVGAASASLGVFRVLEGRYGDTSSSWKQPLVAAGLCGVLAAYSSIVSFLGRMSPRRSWGVAGGILATGSGTFAYLGDAHILPWLGVGLAPLLLRTIGLLLRRKKQDDREPEQDETRPRWLPLVMFAVGSVATLVIGGPILIDTVRAPEHRLGLPAMFELRSGTSSFWPLLLVGLIVSLATALVGLVYWVRTGWGEKLHRVAGLCLTLPWLLCVAYVKRVGHDGWSLTWNTNAATTVIVVGSAASSSATTTSSPPSFAECVTEDPVWSCHGIGADTRYGSPPVSS